MNNNRRSRNRVKAKKGMWMVVVASIMIIVSLMAGKVSLSKRSAALQAKQQNLNKQIKEAEERNKELDSQESYMQTDDYIEEVAREKLGMVKDNEILFKAKDK